MTRSHSFSGVQKTIAAGVAQTITFPANEIEGAGVIGFDIALTGAGNDIANITRVRVLASGDLIMDVTPAFLRTWTEGTHKTGDVQATTDTRFHIPLYDPTLLTRDERDSCQFPIGAQPQVEIDLDNAVAAGIAIIGWTKTDQAPRFASRLYSSVMNIAASQNNARMNIADGGIVRGVIHNTVGISRARLQLSGREVYRLPGPQFLALTIGDLLRSTRMGESPLTITDPLFIPVTFGIPAASGSSFLELDTGAGWAGVANEFGVWSVVPLQRAGNGGNGA